MAKNGERGYHFATEMYFEDGECDNKVSALIGISKYVVVSPLHDADVKEDGELKKAHFHVVFGFPTQKALSSVRTLVENMGFRGAICVANWDKMVRYLCHLDNPEKAQYRVEDVMLYGDISYPKCLENNVADASDLMIARLNALISDERLYSINEVIRYCVSNALIEELKFVQSHSSAVTSMCKGKHFEDAEDRRSWAQKQCQMHSADEREETNRLLYERISDYESVPFGNANF